MMQAYQEGGTGKDAYSHAVGQAGNQQSCAGQNMM
jgi:hypothetical protein